MITVGISIFPEKNSGCPVEKLYEPYAPTEWLNEGLYGYRMSGYWSNAYQGYMDYGQRVVMPYDADQPIVVRNLEGTIKQVVEEILVDEKGIIHGGSISLLYELPNGRDATLPIATFSNNKEGPSKAYRSIHYINHSDQEGVKNINVELNFFQFMDTTNPSNTAFNVYDDAFGNMETGVQCGAINNWLVINQNFPEYSGGVVTHDVVLSCYNVKDNSYIVSRNHTVTLEDVEELILIDRLGIQTGGSQIYVRY